MTVPIYPGPWSFLGEAGKAAGAIGTAIETRQEKEQADAQQGVNFMLTQIAAGRMDPSVMNTPQAQSLLRKARLPVVNLQPSSADIIERTRRGQIQGLTRKAAGTAPMAAGAAVTGQPAGAMLPQGQPMTEDDQAALRALTGVTSGPVARAHERTEMAGADLAEANAHIGQVQGHILDATSQSTIEATIAQNTTQQEVYRSLNDLLGQNPDIPGYNMTARELAAAAAGGFLPAITQRLTLERYGYTMERQMAVDETRTLLEMMSSSSNIYNQQLQHWNTGLQQARTEAELRGANLDDPKQAQAVLNAYTERVGPPPTREGVENEMLKSYGMTRQQYQQRIQHSIGLGGLGSMGPDPAAQPGGDNNQEPTDQNRTNRMIAGAVVEIQRNPGSIPQFIESYKTNVGWTDAMVQAIIARLQDPVKRQFQEAWQAFQREEGTRRATQRKPAAPAAADTTGAGNE